MKIILDANILYGDFHLKGAKIKALCESVKATGDVIYIPEIAVDELINKYIEQVQEYNLKLKKLFSEFTCLLDKMIEPNPFTEKIIEHEVENHRAYFMLQLKKLGIKIIPYPLIPHKELVKRDLARMKPFNVRGQGYRDALIWECVKNLCEKPTVLLNSPRIVFINKNQKDFGEKEGLHQHLKIDLVSNGIDEDFIELINDIDLFDKKYIKPKQKALKNILDEINNKKYYKDIHFFNEIEKIALFDLFSRDYYRENKLFTDEFENPFLTSYGEFSIKTTGVRQISDEQILVEADVEVECEFDVFINQNTAILMIKDDLSSILDYDWNKRHKEVSITRPIKLKVSLIVNSKFKEILSTDTKLLFNKEI